MRRIAWILPWTTLAVLVGCGDSTAGLESGELPDMTGTSTLAEQYIWNEDSSVRCVLRTATIDLEPVGATRTGERYAGMHSDLQLDCGSVTLGQVGATTRHVVPADSVSATVAPGCGAFCPRDVRLIIQSSALHFDARNEFYFAGNPFLGELSIRVTETLTVVHEGKFLGALLYPPGHPRSP